jgi:hypothetical protein
MLQQCVGVVLRMGGCKLMRYRLRRLRRFVGLVCIVYRGLRMSRARFRGWESEKLGEISRLLISQAHIRTRFFVPDYVLFIRNTWFPWLVSLVHSRTSLH